MDIFDKKMDFIFIHNELAFVSYLYFNLAEKRESFTNEERKQLLKFNELFYAKVFDKNSPKIYPTLEEI